MPATATPAQTRYLTCPLINEYRATEEAIKELQERLKSLEQDDKLKKNWNSKRAAHADGHLPEVPA